MDARSREYLDLLFRWNRTYRITAFKDPEEAESQGLAPSLAALEFLPRDARVLDVGSGGGFPAVPLLLARADLAVTLCEPSRAKAAFLREALVRFGLPGKVEPRPVEELLTADRGPWDAVTVRGVHLRHGLLRRLAASLSRVGILIVWSAGERATQYATWLRALDLEVAALDLPGTGLVLLTARVPRGTAPASAVPAAGER